MYYLVISGKVAAEVKSFNDMIVKTKLAAKVPWKPIKIAKPLAYGKTIIDSCVKIIVLLTSILKQKII